MYIRKNRRENEVIKKYCKLGFNVLTKGYPDLCFFNEKMDKVFFIEVKRKSCSYGKKGGLSPHQRKMLEVFKKLGLDVSVEYIA